MSKFVEKDMSGALWNNDDKQKAEQPDWRGTVTVGGTQYWISGWKKVTKDRAEYISLSVRHKEQMPTRVADVQPIPLPAKDFDDELPF